MQRPLEHQFEDDLGQLVDRYLLQGIDLAWLKCILIYESNHDHAERFRDLQWEGTHTGPAWERE